ncbi:transient receptor potential cation channel subfamily V member 6-like [Ptychodera flava]|uniref:transient receptor potential cation channel subfamily V member 6-like n=1 Tax=Ptychodera flava TaxID=63121 RepID=UPI00396AA188
MGECNSKSEDKWKKQHDKYQLYQLIKIEGGGELLNDYQKGGKFLSEEVIKEKLKEYLYSPEDGETKEIEPYENCKDLDANETHKACWKKEKELRGGVGETILHVCFLKGTEDHKEIAKSILACYPNLVLDIYEEDEYYGESCLHLAIVNNDLESVKMLVEKKAVLDQRATGRFFKRNNQKGGLLVKHSGYGGHAYYGEYPLHFAASVGNIDIYNYLVDQKPRASEQGQVDPNAQDSYGNTALHMAVIHNNLVSPITGDGYLQ